MRFNYRLIAVVAALGICAPASAAIDAKAATDILTKAGCNACHQQDKKVLGPAYKDVSAKYKGNAKAPDLLMQKVRAGGSGVYGPIPMPPNPKEKINDDDLRKLVTWILTL
ncbi:MAG: c-type cytochrome [Betaproteobacteria bacterium]|nr:c-type cytochrome [Betaproteobacteria bacterium]